MLVFAATTEVATVISLESGICLPVPKLLILPYMALAPTRFTACAKISKYEVDVLNPTNENILTLVTCVPDQAQTYRWCVQAAAV